MNMENEKECKKKKLELRNGAEIFDIACSFCHGMSAVDISQVLIDLYFEGRELGYQEAKELYRWREPKVTRKKKIKITFTSLNQEKPHTCGSCKHTDNDLGFFACHCDIWEKVGLSESKVRSWHGEKCKHYEKQEAL